MLGVVEAARIESGIVRPVFIHHTEPISAELRAQLGEDAYREAMRRGSSKPLDQAVADGLASVEGSPAVARTLPRLFELRAPARRER